MSWTLRACVLTACLAGCSALRDGVSQGMERAAEKLGPIGHAADGTPIADSAWVVVAAALLSVLLREVDKRWVRKK